MASPDIQTKRPVVSVIIPVYNVEKYLPECIESVRRQTFEDFEMILVDDGSPDNSGKICDDYAARDSRIRVFHKEMDFKESDCSLREQILIRGHLHLFDCISNFLFGLRYGMCAPFGEMICAWKRQESNRQPGDKKL